ncbi:RING-H2 finger protein ATL46 [Dichanthelium oligosanthes]|uniref:RING-type E3 ubiquitin transferase n=1 Tax=Dichanthelium oligosanthes TaxID=888268 RepID=A0A1E5W9P6_9POAL|nr:RING-H2 finger protein ATL46 [Dichanthelium oligosanthes]
MMLLGLATGLAVAGEVKKQDDGGASSGGGGHGSVIGPAVVYVLVIVVVVLLVSSLLHLLVRCLRRRARARGEGGGGDGLGDAEGGGDGEESALQRQLQQLFHLHDAGLDQDVIDALPVFLYREVVGAAGAGAKEPFDCAVCLCEFAGEDRLRLLPLCGHAFHIDCIDTWLLSNSTCPLCRCALGADAAALLDAFDDEEGWKHEDAVLPVRLGKFKNLSRAAPVPVHDGAGGIVTREAGETSSSSLDDRRCYSMGSYQYVLAEASLQVSVHRRHGDGHARAGARLRGVGANHAVPEAAAAAGAEGKRIGAGSKGDSFSVSKIWQWPRNGKGKLPVLASDDSPAMNGRLPWQRRSPGDS